MKIKFANGESIDILLSESVLKNHLMQAYKHLRHIKMPFRFWHYGGHSNNFDSLVLLFEQAAIELGIVVDRHQCIQNNQLYFNHLHTIYELNYDGRCEWMDYHDLLHACESTAPSKMLKLIYNDLAGPLVGKFDRTMLQSSSTRIRAGDVFCSWQELGKTPYRYWQDKEPNNIDRVLELVKPWSKLGCDLHVALEDIDFVPNEQIMADFCTWWRGHQETWCQHWGLMDWTHNEQFAVIRVGRIQNLDELVALLQQNTYPISVIYDHNTQAESLRFDIVLMVECTHVTPFIQVKIDNVVIPTPDLVQGMNTISFDCQIFSGPHTLTLERQGKTSLDPNQMVTIQHISVDNLDMSQCILSCSYFKPEYPEPWASQQKTLGYDLAEIVPFETVLGHNGVWTLNFDSPFYPYFLKHTQNPWHPDS